MWSLWRTCVVLACASGALAQRGDPGDQRGYPGGARARDRDLSKADEPSCDQLKAMWRFSKRQARAPELVNEVSSYRDPLLYNEWPLYSAAPRAAPRFRYQYPSVPREAYGRVLTKAPPNVVRTPDYDEMFGMLSVPHAGGKVLRYPGPSRARASPPAFMVPPQRDRFEALKKLIRQEHVRELQRKYETEQRQELKDITSGRGDEYAYGGYGEPEPRAPPAGPDEPVRVPHRKPAGGSRQAAQFSRYADALLPPSRRALRARAPGWVGQSF